MTLVEFLSDVVIQKVSVSDWSFARKAGGSGDVGRS